MPLLSDYPYPRRWADMSLDFKGMFVCHGVVMVMFAAGGALTVPVELVVEGGALVTVSTLSVANRLRRGWRWRGAGVKQILAAFLMIGAAGLVAGAGSPLASPLNPHILPWYLALLNIGLFNTLAALRLAAMSQAEFDADCGPRATTPQAPQTPLVQVDEPLNWKRVVIIVHRTVFIAVWLEFMVFIYEFSVAFRDGSPTQSAAQPEPLTNHGAVVYIATHQKHLIDVLQIIGLTGIPVVILSAFLLQAVGVRVLGDRPLVPRGFGARP